MRLARLEKELDEGEEIDAALTARDGETNGED